MSVISVDENQWPFPTLALNREVIFASQAKDGGMLQFVCMNQIQM